MMVGTEVWGRAKSVEHDGFPAYELYVNGVQVYTYNPANTGQGLSALRGGMDVCWDSPWMEVP